MTDGIQSRRTPYVERDIPFAYLSDGNKQYRRIFGNLRSDQIHRKTRKEKKQKKIRMHFQRLGDCACADEIQEDKNNIGIHRGDKRIADQITGSTHPDQDTRFHYPYPQTRNRDSRRDTSRL